MNAAVIGAGLMGQWHSYALRRSGVKLAIVIDSDETRGRALAAKYNANWSGELESIKSANLNSVHVCSPPDEHMRHVAASLDAGAHCLVEKPMAQSEADTSTLLTRAEDAKRIICPSHQFLFQKGMMSAFRGLGRLAELRHCSYVCCTAGASSTPERVSLVRDILPHPLSLMRRIEGDDFGKISWNAYSTADGEATVFGEGSAAAFSILISTHGRPTRNEITLIGDGGSWHADLYHGFAVFEGPRVSRFRKTIRPIKAATVSLGTSVANLSSRAIGREPAFPGLIELTRRYYAAIQRGESEGPITSRETLDVAIARDAVIQGLERSSLA